MEPFEQQVVNNNKEIYAKIQHELQQATSEVLLATGWFTDEDLYNTLSSKLDQGISVEIIIADNQDNEKLDFGQLTAKGAAVYKIKSSGYGVMNQKFCVIDKRIALHGSYNWTVNAKKNNHESIICTTHQATVDALIQNFNTIKNRISEQGAETTRHNGHTIDKPATPEAPQPDPPLKAGAEFEKVLDSMIAAEIGNFDRKLLREQGFDRASANNGDHQVLHKSFDTLYSVFINDIDVIDDKKKRLISKIEEYRIKSQDNLTKKCEIEVDFLDRHHAITKTNLEIKTTKITAEIESTTKRIDVIKENKIPLKENENATLDQQIKMAEQASAQPKFKWFDFIPVIIFNAALISYLFLFYSSAAYILLFSIQDAKAQEAQGIPIAEAQIFNPEAVTQAFGKTGTAPLFIFLFVFIPLSFAVSDRFIRPKFKTLASVLSFLFGILVLDVAIAYKVAQSVYEVNYLRGNVNERWALKMAFSDVNFYLVFVFGAFGLLLFKLAFKKLLSIFEERSPDSIAQGNQLKIKHFREEMAINSDKILLFTEDIATLQISIMQWRVDVKQIDLELTELPVQLNRDLQKKRTQLLKDSENIDRIAAIYTIHIQSDNLPISVDALKDRINIFLEGWNDFLHKEYAIPKATSKSAQATAVAAEWQAEKLYASKIDKRVKITQDV